ncbi:DUF72 domain-containing protein [Ligilactobacillus faecis]|uniref:DUF72 domain-containing protein n=1 Tax=Ligilactobacillus faecis TaxID=762833 RepID=UPI0024696A7F|nr:DUF72 domain-containing protein [Ligilactobacillus faecis]WGN90554.1 DUF72 domain-containing protein [Ligilactobacillus faecis]
MITLGATTWSEHQALIADIRPVKLEEYAAFFPVVEVDTFFYAIPTVQTIENWQTKVPKTFSFVVKANRVMTGHSKEKITLAQLNQTFLAFKTALAPLLATDQLKTVLFQFPPYFTPTKKSINYLRQIRQWLPQIPICLEFRTKAWYRPQTLPSLLKFCTEQSFTLTVADEPTQTEASVPFAPYVTTPELMFWRLHGRNQQGWLKKGPDWRKERTLYCYSKEELLQFKETILAFTSQVKEVCVIFNNNSAGDAAPNALLLKELLGLEFSGLAPKPPTQLKLL